MFGIGGTEFIVILIIAILVIGPKDIPRVLYQLGKFVGQIRRMTQSVTDGLHDLSRTGELEDIITNANQAGDDMTDFRIQQQQALETQKQKRKPSKKTKSKPKLSKHKGKKS